MVGSRSHDVSWWTLGKRRTPSLPNYFLDIPLRLCYNGRKWKEVSKVIHINILPKKVRRQSLKRLGIAYSAFSKLRQYHSDRVIECQQEVIRALKNELSLYKGGR